MPRRLHVRQRVGVGTHQCVVHDVERRFDVFQALEDVAVAHAGQLARRDGRGRTRVALLLAGEDTGHHDVLDLLLVLHQSDQSGLCRGKRLRDVADVREDQVVAALGHADRESAVGTRHDSRAGPLDQDVHAHERRTGRIRHASADDLVRSFLRGGLMALPWLRGRITMVSSSIEHSSRVPRSASSSTSRTGASALLKEMPPIPARRRYYKGCNIPSAV